MFHVRSHTVAPSIPSQVPTSLALILVTQIHWAIGSINITMATTKRPVQDQDGFRCKESTIDDGSTIVVEGYCAMQCTYTGLCRARKWQTGYILHS